MDLKLECRRLDIAIGDSSAKADLIGLIQSFDKNNGIGHKMKYVLRGKTNA